METGPKVGELVRMDGWVRRMIADYLRLTDVPVPPYEATAVARLCRDEVAVVLDVAVVEVSDGIFYDKYYRILGPSGVGWVGSNYLESAEADV